jgi:cytoplasmic iron level regulating protein YaaA (DUF328/UPF0246 family)
MSKSIALVSCVSKKQSIALPAKSLYLSDWFKKASAYAIQNADHWYILSAKYGLLDPDTVIEPYDETLNIMPIAARRLWGKEVLENLLQKTEEGDKLIFLAGQRYREFLIQPLKSRGYQIEIPMAGLRIGEQLRWLGQ